MATTSRITEIPRRSFNRTHPKTGNGSPIINNAPDIRSPVWTEPKSKTMTAYSVVPARKVPVLYYLSRNGRLEHPHLIDVPLSSPHGLHLRDVMNCLNYHRGKGMANTYSWSFKRSYKNGYVWHDVSEDDVIQPTNDHDYVLKGTELLHAHASQIQPERYHTGDICSSKTAAAAAVDTEAMIVKRNRSWSSFDNPQEYLVMKCESSRELMSKFAPDAATQTEEQRSPEHVSVDLGTEEVPSPPPSNSSSEVVEAVSGSRYGGPTVEVRDRDQTVEYPHSASGRMKASRVLMQLITCGADSVKHVSHVTCTQDQGYRKSVEYGKI